MPDSSRRIRSKPWIAAKHALQRVLGLQRVQLGQPAPGRLLGHRRWYFMVQVPKRLMFIIPSVSWLSRR